MKVESSRYQPGDRWRRRFIGRRFAPALLFCY